MSEVNWNNWQTGVPTYGWYGGKGYTGGANTIPGLTPDYNPPPANGADALYKQHDWNIDHGMSSLEADLTLLSGLEAFKGTAEYGELSVVDRAYVQMSETVFTYKSTGEIAIGLLKQLIESGLGEKLGNEYGGGPGPGTPGPGTPGPGTPGPGTPGPGTPGPGTPGPGTPGPGTPGPGTPGPGTPGPGTPGPGTGWPPKLPPVPLDPLVLDLDNDGLELTSVGVSTTYFDFDGDGFAEKTGWLAPDDGFLAVDSNGNGTIDGIGELFGNQLIDGFTALASFDSNHDGNVDSLDVNFSSLRVWRDLNGDGVSSSNEVFSLADAGIQSISTNGTTSSEQISGNLIGFTGEFGRTDGSIGIAAAAFFQTDRALTQWQPPEGFQVSAEASILPSLKGYGQLPNLEYSMSLRSDLLEVVQDFVTNSATYETGAELRSAFVHVLLEWAEVDEVDPSSRGAFIDGKIAAFLEKFFGSPLSQASPNARYAESLMKAYDVILDGLLTRFLSEIPTSLVLIQQINPDDLQSPFLALSTLNYDAQQDVFLGDVSTAIKYVVRSAPEDNRAALHYFDLLIPSIMGLRADAFDGDPAAFRSEIAEQLSLSQIDDLALREYVLSLAETRSVKFGNSESLIGSDKLDVLYGSGESEYISGGNGSDVYAYVRGDGNLTIEDQSGSDNDRLVLIGVNASDVSLVRNGNNLTLQIAESSVGAGDGGSVTLNAQLDDWFGQAVEEIVLADGTAWTPNDLRLMLLDQASTAGDDTIVGFNVDDIIRGGTGDDTISGGGGDDTYFYARGDGNDVVIEGTSGNFSTIDTLVLEGINPADVSLVRNGGDVTLMIRESAPGAGDGGSVLLKDGFEDWFSQGVENIVFADGTIWTQVAIREMLIESAGTAANDTIVGSGAADVITGRGGDDTLNGGAGDDTYVYTRGDGDDVITEGTVGNFSSYDTLILHDVAPAAVQLVRDGNNVTLVIAESAVGAGDAGSVRIVEGLDAWFSRGVEQIVFDNGTIWTQAAMRAALLVDAATAGDDLIHGFPGDDVIAGGHGDDIILGGGGSDTYTYASGDGRDVIDNQSSSSPNKLVLYGIAVADVTVVRNAGNAILLFGAGGIDGRVTIKEQFGGGGKITSVEFDDGTVWTDQTILANAIASDGSIVTHFGTAGADDIVGTVENDVIDGRGGADILRGGNGNDTYHYGLGSGDDTIVEGSGGAGSGDHVKLAGLNASDVELTRLGNDLFLKILSSGETLKVNDQFNGDTGIEQISFADNTVWDRSQIQAASWIRGTGGDDTISGGGGDENIDGGAGNDILSGNTGSDTYLFGVGAGNDTIVEAWHSSGTDVVRLENLLPADVQFGQDGNDLVILITSSGEQLRVTSQFDGTGNGIEQVTFADSTTWDRSQIVEASWLRGTSGNDTITGGGGNEKIDGGAGNDTLAGRGGGDTYLYGVGSGNDTINEVWYDGGTDTVKLAGLLPADVRFTQVSSDLIIEIISTGEQLKISNQLAGEGIEQVIFSDNTSWDRAQIQSATWIRGTAAAETIVGGNNADQIDGEGGNDTLSGGAGGDTYLFAAGSGNDTVTESGYDGTTDIVKLADLVVSDVAFSRVANDLVIQIITSGETLTISNQYSTGANAGIEQIVFADQTYHSPTSMTLSGNSVAENSSNGTVVGTVSGVDPNSADTLGYVLINSADGRFSINATTGVISVANGLLINYETATSYNVTVRVTDQTGLKFDQSLTINVTDVYEDPNVVWLYGTAASETIYGTSVAEMIDSKAGDDNVRGGNGGDTYIYGVGSGNDTVSEFSSDVGADVIQLTGLNAADTVFSRSGNDLFIQIGSSGETLRVESQFNGTNGIEQIAFADSSTWTRSQILEAAWIRGTAGNEDLYGSADADVFDGKGGNDGLHGGSAGDTYVYGVGSGNDTIDENSDDSGTDTIRLVGLAAADVVFSRSGNDLLIQIGSSGEILRVTNQFNGTNGIEQIAFADSSTWTRSQILEAAWIRGTAGNEDLYGSADADVFDGKGGNDGLHGGSAGDTYVFTVGSGNDTIDENSGNSGTDTIRLVGLAAADVVFSRSGNDLLIQIGSSGETLSVTNQFNGTNGIEQVTFADSSTWDRSQILEAAWIRGTSGNEDLYGSADADVFDGKGGNDGLHGGGAGDTYVFAVGSGNDTVDENSGNSGTDTIRLVGLVAADVTFGRSGNDLLIEVSSSGETLRVTNQFNGTNGIEQVVFADNATWDRTQIAQAAWFRGTSGADSIIGSASDDFLAGGLGNDTLRGYDGNDTYVYTSGDGNDTVDDQSASTTQIDTLRFTNLNASDLTVSRTGGDLVVTVNASGETIRLANQFYSPSYNYGIEKFEFADGSSWNFQTINANAWYRGTWGNDSITASSWNETLAGGLGNDYLRGNDGDDTYVYASGDGNDTIDDQSGSTTQIDTLKLTNLNAGDVTVSRVGGDLMINVNATGESIKVSYQFYSPSYNYGIEKLEFANGGSWDLQTINANGWYRGTSGNDSITASSWNETLAGGLGNDYLRGNDGDDTYVYTSGDGNDTIDDQSGSITQIDTLKFTNLNASDLTVSRVGVDLMINVNATGETIKLAYQFYSQGNNYGIEKFEFADGSSWNFQTINANAWTRGTAGNDTISGASWNDSIAGGAGNDTLSGAGGNDTFIFRANLGQDIVTDFTAGQDVLEFGDGIFADAAAALAAATASGNNTIITIDANNSVLLQNVALANLQLGDFHIV